MSGAAMRVPGRRTDRLGKLTSIAPVPKISTKALLIDKGELLFGQHGIDGISLREIALAAGQSNSNVVQYHFKDKAGLVHAILKDRLSRIEVLRRAYFQALDPAAHADPRALLKVLWRATVSLRGEQGDHPFCRFFLHYSLQPQVAQHPIFGTVAVQGPSAKPRAAAKNFPCTIEIAGLLRNCYAALDLPTFRQRISLMGLMFLAAVSEHDHAQAASRRKRPAEFDLEPILDIAIGALSAPF